MFINLRSSIRILFALLPGILFGQPPFLDQFECSGGYYAFKMCVDRATGLPVEGEFIERKSEKLYHRATFHSGRYIVFAFFHEIEYQIDKKNGYWELKKIHYEGEWRELAWIDELHYFYADGTSDDIIKMTGATKLKDD